MDMPLVWGVEWPRVGRAGGDGNATVGVLGFAGGAGRLAGMGAMSIMVQLSVLRWLGL